MILAKFLASERKKFANLDELMLRKRKIVMMIIMIMTITIIITTIHLNHMREAFRYIYNMTKLFDKYFITALMYDKIIRF